MHIKCNAATSNLTITSHTNKQMEHTYPALAFRACV